MFAASPATRDVHAGDARACNWPGSVRRSLRLSRSSRRKRCQFRSSPTSGSGSESHDRRPPFGRDRPARRARRCAGGTRCERRRANEPHGPRHDRRTASSRARPQCAISAAYCQAGCYDRKLLELCMVGLMAWRDLRVKRGCIRRAIGKRARSTHTLSEGTKRLVPRDEPAMLDQIRGFFQPTMLRMVIACCGIQA